MSMKSSNIIQIISYKCHLSIKNYLLLLLSEVNYSQAIIYIFFCKEINKSRENDCKDEVYDELFDEYHSPINSPLIFNGHFHQIILQSSFHFVIDNSMIEEKKVERVFATLESKFELFLKHKKCSYSRHEQTVKIACAIFNKDLRIHLGLPHYFLVVDNQPLF